MADAPMPMVKLFDVLYDHGPTSLAYITSEMEPMGAPAVLKSLRLFFDRGHVTCDKVGVGVVWGLSDQMRREIAATRGVPDPRLPAKPASAALPPSTRVAPKAREPDVAPPPAAPAPVPEPKPKPQARKRREVKVRPFIPARPEVVVSDTPGWVWITERDPHDTNGETIASIGVQPDEIDALCEALQEMKRNAA